MIDILRGLVVENFGCSLLCDRVDMEIVGQGALLSWAAFQTPTDVFIVGIVNPTDRFVTRRALETNF
ncbi:hypothetical protein GCM10009647_090550 [Streptomyces sanglieri]